MKKQYVKALYLTFFIQMLAYSLFNLVYAQRVNELDPYCGFDPCVVEAQPFSFTPTLIFVLFLYLIVYFLYLYYLIPYMHNDQLSIFQQIIMLIILQLICAFISIFILSAMYRFSGMPILIAYYSIIISTIAEFAGIVGIIAYRIKCSLQINTLL